MNVGKTTNQILFLITYTRKMYHTRKVYNAYHINITNRYLFSYLSYVLC